MARPLSEAFTSSGGKRAQPTVRQHVATALSLSFWPSLLAGLGGQNFCLCQGSQSKTLAPTRGRKFPVRARPRDTRTSTGWLGGLASGVALAARPSGGRAAARRRLGGRKGAPDKRAERQSQRLSRPSSLGCPAVGPTRLSGSPTTPPTPPPIPVELARQGCH